MMKSVVVKNKWSNAVGISAFVFICVVAGSAPYWSASIALTPTPVDLSAFTGWPKTMAGKTLKRIPLSNREKKFQNGFPGRIARFSDGHREWIIRWIAEPSRKVHPAADCFKGMGYAIKAQPIFVDESDCSWNCFMATKDGTALRIRERLTDARGNSFSDVSAWYWAATIGESKGPWWAYTVAEILNGTPSPKKGQ